MHVQTCMCVGAVGGMLESGLGRPGCSWGLYSVREVSVEQC